MTKEELADRLLNFAVRIGKVVDALADTRLGRHVAGQLIRCGTSPAPNYDEACAAESPRDFVHKLSIVRCGTEGIQSLDSFHYPSGVIARKENGGVRR